MPTKQSSTLAKGLQLLRAVTDDGGLSTLSEIAARLGIPLPTAHRLAVTLKTEGFLERDARGYYLPGRALSQLFPDAMTATDRIAMRLRRPMRQLALKHGVSMHFGVLEDGMVTYLVKENGGEQELFTKERMQLEAYCSGIGKTLLAALPQDALERYLANGPFVPLTAHTLTQPDAIRRELEQVRKAGVAYDRFEVREDIFCMAVPVTDPQGITIGGLSASFLDVVPETGTLRTLRGAMRSRITKAMAKSHAY